MGHFRFYSHRSGTRGVISVHDLVGRRIFFFRSGLLVLMFLIVARLFILQVVDAQIYREIAFGGRSLQAQLEPKRGELFMQSLADRKDIPLVLNEDRFLVYADGRYIENGENIVKRLSEVLHVSQEESDVLREKMSKIGTDPYEPLFPAVSEFSADVIRELNLEGIGSIRMPHRFYPEGSDTAHVSGFFGVGADGERIGQYGLEGYFESVLAGERGQLRSESDPLGAWIPLSEREYKPAVHGARIVTSIDAAIQKFACDTLVQDARRFDARRATLIIMDPRVGEVLAMCNVPSFDANAYAETPDVTYFNNDAIFTPYEPGSVFKPLVMAAALDQGSVSPRTFFTDVGYKVVDDFTIKNALEKVYGAVTMTDVLVRSINTGMIYVAESLGHELFAEYVERFGFGKLTGIELDTEVSGTIENVYKRGDVFLATASFGQGITATPMQLVNAYSVMAHQGKLLKPSIVKRIEYDDGRVEEHQPEEIKQVISPRTAAQISSMLVAVVEGPHARRASVPGYLIAGKTGTAQIADTSGGYGEEFNHTFIGYGPADDADFVMLVKYERPNEKFAETTAAATFGTVARFLVEYMRISPDS